MRSGATSCRHLEIHCVSIGGTVAGIGDTMPDGPDAMKLRLCASTTLDRVSDGTDARIGSD